VRLSINHVKFSFYLKADIFFSYKLEICFNIALMKWFSILLCACYGHHWSVRSRNAVIAQVITVTTLLRPGVIAEEKVLGAQDLNKIRRRLGPGNFFVFI
jgi:hypothetical protein